MKSVRIGRELEHVTIRLGERSPDAATQDLRLAERGYEDANWITAHIEIAVGGFEGRYSASLERTDFSRFRGALKKLYSFESSQGGFSTMEGLLHIDICGDRRGNFEAICVARDDGEGNRLEFKLQFDQTFIPRMLTELDAIIEAYPVLGKKPTVVNS